MKTKHIKIVILGDKFVDKTSLELTFESGEFPQEYIPLYYDNYFPELIFNEEQTIYKIHIWDTKGDNDYDSLRHFSYPQTDIFLLCFSLASRQSFNRIKQKWVKDQLPIQFDECLKLKEEIGALNYIECSSRDKKNVTETFEFACRYMIQNGKKKKKRIV